jgi:hypothetical protein
MSHSKSVVAGRPVTRRRFLHLTLTALGATILAGSGLAFFDWLGLKRRWRSAQNHLIANRYAFMPADRRIRKHFGDLTIDEEGLERFVHDFEMYVGRVTFYSVTTNGRLFSTFLLSTDYYRNGADPKKLVRYVAFYDPYVSPCWNPFIRA